MLSRLAYRTRQFWNALPGLRRQVETHAALAPLTSAQLILFRRMQASEQAHAQRMFRRLQADGHADADLLAAALLHDVGKTLYPLTVLDRVVVVLGKRLFPCLARRWSEGVPWGLRRPFVIAAHHAEWGADLAARVGASPHTVELIRRHQDAPSAEEDSHIERLLAALQAVDGES